MKRIIMYGCLNEALNNCVYWGYMSAQVTPKYGRIGLIKWNLKGMLFTGQVLGKTSIQ